MSGTKDQTYAFRFEDDLKAVEYGERIGKPFIIVRLDEPEYADKPFMYVAQEWVIGIKKKEEETN